MNIKKWKGKRINNSAKYAQNIEELLIQESNGKLKETFDLNYVNYLYDSYIQPLSDMEDKIKEKLKKIKTLFYIQKNGCSIAPIPSIVSPSLVNGSPHDRRSTINDEEDKSPSVSPIRIRGLRIWRTQCEKPKDPSSVVSLISSEINIFAGSLVDLWNQYIQHLEFFPQKICNLYREDYNQSIFIAFERYIHETHSTRKTFPIFIEKDVAEEHRVLLKNIKDSLFNKKEDSIPVS